MQTLTEFVQEHINRKAALAYDSEAILREAHEAETRLRHRMESDPSLDIFVSHYANGFVSALKIIPANMQTVMIRQLLAQIITEWEDCNIAFQNQLKPIPQ